MQGRVWRVVPLLIPRHAQVAALENQLASTITATASSSSSVVLGSPFAVPALGGGGGLLRRSLDSGIKTKATLRLEEEGGAKGGIVQRQFPPFFTPASNCPDLLIAFLSPHPPSPPLPNPQRCQYRRTLSRTGRSQQTHDETGAGGLTLPFSLTRACCALTRERVQELESKEDAFRSKEDASARQEQLLRLLKIEVRICCCTHLFMRKKTSR